MKRILKISALGGLGFLLLAAAPSAQTTDPAWRAVNTQPAQVVPLYVTNGQDNPFPLLVVPVDPSLERMKQVNAALDAAKTNVKAMVARSDAFIPDIADLHGDAYMEGAAGKMVLVDGNWMRQGDKIAVGIQENPAVLAAIAQLRNMDMQAGQAMEDELGSRMATQHSMRLAIEAIQSTTVMLGGDGIHVKMPIRQESF